MKDKLYGDDVIVARVLDKVELALRRAAIETSSALLESVAREIAVLSKELWND